MSEFLLSISGVERSLLARAPGERNKFIGIGGAILTTAAMAFVSMTFALAVALDVALPLAAVLGAFWGVAILNLDRWLVVATKRQGRWWRDISMAVPRLLLALVIGAVVSEPLVLWVFDKEIAVEVQAMQREDKADFEQQLRNDVRFKDLPALEAEKASVDSALAGGLSAADVLADPGVVAAQQHLDAVSGQLEKVRAQTVCEGQGTCGTGAAGAGPVFAENKRQLASLEAEYAASQQALDAAKSAAAGRLQAEASSLAGDRQKRSEELAGLIDRAKALRASEQQAFDDRAANADGLLMRIEGLDRLSGSDEGLRHAREALFLFILSIECMPILVKLFLNLAKPTLYEQLQQVRDDAVHDEAVLRETTRQEELRMQAEAALDAAEARTRTELDAHVRASRIVLDAQVDVVRHRTQEWQDRARTTGRPAEPPLHIDLDAPLPGQRPAPATPYVDLSEAPTDEAWFVPPVTHGVDLRKDGDRPLSSPYPSDRPAGGWYTDVAS